MKINLAKSAGFCFGVKRAIDIALSTIKKGIKVYMLGDIVHNEIVIKNMREKGIKKITRMTKGKNKTLLIRAHGTGVKTIKKALLLNYNIIDATCPMVKEIHKIAKTMERQGYRVIIIGDKKHDEVKGIIGQLKNKAIVIDQIQNIPYKIIKQVKKAAIVVQSTQNIQKAAEIFNKLKKEIKKLKIFNTICNPTRIKQEEIKKLPLENDVMIIIGSKNSANTKRLYEISKSLNTKSFWIQSKNEINPRWFIKAKNAGITAGASTPDSTIKETAEYIKNLR